MWSPVSKLESRIPIEKKKKLRHIQFYQSSIIDVGRRKELVVGNENDFYVQQNDFYVHIPHIHSVLDDGH